jgi:hypothetical protein
MRIPRSVAAFAVVISFAATATGQIVSSQIEVEPVRDRAANQPRTGTGVIRGRVVDGISGAGLARARIRLQMSGVHRPSVLTGSDGEFAFETLPTGTFSIFVNKSTYLGASYPERARTVRGRRPAVLANAQVIDGVVVKLYHGGAISGRVLDAYGDPVEYASVTAQRVRAGSPRREMHDIQTNDLGEFRVSRLEPGSYVLAVVPRRMFQEEPMPDAELQPVPTYYPGALSPDQAQVITLERGQTLTGIEVVLAEGTPVVVNGVVLGSDGQPAAGDGFVNARAASQSGAGMFMGGGAGLRADGTFRMQLHPGAYVLEARVRPRGASGPGLEQMGMIRLNVGGSATEAVTIVVGKGATASGRVVFEGTGTAPPPLTAPVHLPLHSGDGSCQTAEARVSADWTFRADGLFGTCASPPFLTFGRWTLKAVLKDGEDLLGRTLTFEPGQRLDGLQLVFTDRRSDLNFHVTDDQGPTKDYVALVFPTDRSRWTGDRPVDVRMFMLPPPEVLAAMQQTPGARMPRELMPIAPGEYFIVALDDIAEDEMRTAAVLEQLSAHAVRVSVTEGTSVDVSLRRVERARVVR